MMRLRRVIGGDRSERQGTPPLADDPFESHGARMGLLKAASVKSQIWSYQMQGRQNALSCMSRELLK
jgi:hypothetical protein